MSVIVTNAKNRIAYNIVRSLGLKGIDVVASDSSRNAMSFASKYAKEHFVYPSPYNANQREFIDCIIGNIQRHKASVLMPVLEETYVISKYKNELLKHTAMVVPDYDQILLAHNKDKWETVAHELNIRTPQTYDIERIKEGKLTVNEGSYPLLIKPKQGGGGWGISQIDSRKELEMLLSKDRYLGRSWNRFYVQEKIDGDIVCVAMLFNRGQLRAKVAYRQLREYPVKCGQATLRISVNCPQAEEHLQFLLEHLRWHGVCQADFIMEKSTGIPCLIDVNPRFWGSLAQGIASGVDFPHLYYQIAMEGDVKPVLTFKTNVMTRWIGGDLRSFLPSLLESPDKLQFIREFIFPAGGGTVKDDFYPDDPLPFFTWYLDAAMRAIRQRSFSPGPHEALEGIWE